MYALLLAVALIRCAGLMAGRGTPVRPGTRDRIVPSGTKTEQLDNRYGSLRRRPGAVGWRSRVIDHDASKSLLPSTDPDRTSFAIEKGGWNPVNRIRASIRRIAYPRRVEDGSAMPMRLN